MKYLILLTLTAFMSGCGMLQKSEDNYKQNYDRYLASQVTCIQHDKNTVSLTDSGGQPITISHAAGNCDDVEDPIHGGEYVAQLGSAAIQAGGNIVSAGISAYTARRNSDDSNETRVLLAELENAREADENAVIRDAISANSEQFGQLIAQNGETAAAIAGNTMAVTDLIAILTADDEAEGEADEEQ